MVYPTKALLNRSNRSYEVIAVSGSKTLGTSNNVDAVVLPPGSTTVSGNTSTSNPTSAPNLARSKSKVSIIVGSIFAIIILLAFLLLLIIFFIRRRHRITKRWSFHRELLVQCHQHPHVMARTPPTILHSSSIASHSEDPERGLHTLAPAVPSMQQPNQDSKLTSPDPVVYPTSPPPVARLRGHRPVLHRLELGPYNAPLPRGPLGPRSPLRQSPGSRSPLRQSPESQSPSRQSPRSRSPLLPSPRTDRQRAIADEIQVLQIQMLESELKGGIAMYQKLAWLREQQEGPWALGSTEVIPRGYDRYMT
ncbi:hypothetical protein BYT27DRAFT_6873119 [Phlegmacium glaucopus]|nr:hypothetical protein BYT27DRAFT_6873119 [Phlegmacium glaucopus]